MVPKHVMLLLAALALASSAPAQEPPRAADEPFVQWTAVRTVPAPDAPASAEPVSDLAAAGVDPAALDGEVRQACRDGSGIVWVATGRGLVVRFPGRAPVRLSGRDGLPYPDLRCVDADDEAVWLGTPSGLVRFDGQRWQSFRGPRWLPADDVQEVRVIGGRPHARIPAGWCALAPERLTLADKAARLEAVLAERHLRHGLIAESFADDALAPTRWHPHDTDNDGLWTGMYLAAECFRYAATGDEAAARAAHSAFAAMARLTEITGIPGFPARTVVTREEGHGGGEWHPVGDGARIWKGDTSSDEIVGHFFAYGLYYDLVAREGEERERVRRLVDAIMGHIVDHGFNLCDADGKPTSFGRWGPDYTRSVEGYFAAGLQALEVLSHLRVALHVTGNPRWQEALDLLVRKHGYDRMVLRQKYALPGFTNHSDDELAFLSFYPLLRYEIDPKLRATWEDAVMRSWRIEKPEHSPLWNFIAGSARGARGDPDLAASVEWLRDCPLDLREWAIDNRGRADVRVSGVRNRHRDPVFGRVLPISERRVMRWNGDPYASVQGGGDGRHEMEPTFWLLPYWMGRYHGFLAAPEAK